MLNLLLFLLLPANNEVAAGEDDSLFTLPDIKDALRKREMQEEIARIKEEEKELKPKIKRGDIDAYQKVFESYLCQIMQFPKREN